jgi:TRAP-type C4-dicarboxylate transport system substrate-binding protein
MKLMKYLLPAIAATLLASGPAAALDIKISHQWKEGTDARDKAAREFVKEVNKRDPSIKFRIYPASSLNIKPVAQLDAIQSGTIEMAIYPMSYAVGKAPEFSITIMPGVVNNLDHALKMKNTPFHKKLQEIAHRNGIHIVTWWWTPGAFASKDREITGPDSVKGLTVRAADPTFEAMIRAAGASVVAMPSSEIYPAMQSGVLNAALTSCESFVSYRLYEQTKFATVGEEHVLWMLLQPLILSKSVWDKLTPEQQKAFQEAADKSDEFFAADQRKTVGDMTQKFTQAGAKVRKMSKEEFDAWVALAKKTSWEEFKAKTPDGKELLELAAQVK